MTKRDDTHERRPRGFYPTPWPAFAPLIPHLRRGLRVVEPCAGDGTLCHHLANAGMMVVWASDISPQHPNVVKYDALELGPNSGVMFNCFVTNPPWPEPQRKGEPTLTIVNHLCNIAPTWVLLPADFMHNVYARELMTYCHQIVSVGRVKWIPGTNKKGYDNAAWYLFTSEKTPSLTFSGNAGATEKVS